MTTPAELLEVLEVLEDIRDTQPRLAYGVRAAGRRLGVSEAHIRRLVDAGVLPRVPHMGRRVVIAHHELERLIAAPSPDVAQPPVELPRRTA